MLEMAGVVCFLFCFGSVEDLKQVPVQDFCKRYERQVLTRDEVEHIKKLPRNLRDKIQGNDLDYLCQCRKWDSPRCKTG